MLNISISPSTVWKTPWRSNQWRRCWSVYSGTGL